MDADKIINAFLHALVNNLETKQNLYQRLDKIIEKHFSEFNSKILKRKIRGALIDAFAYGLQSGVYYTKNKEQKSEDEED